MEIAIRAASENQQGHNSARKLHIMLKEEEFMDGSENTPLIVQA
ncbi:hypothetical protein [Acidithiobacillus thiooxidans]|nr:hypothetical protein [Acidithiobacillus sp.]